ncbi:zeta toxin domain, P-loop containing nucleoside triphosphate hydrolase [Tanacetum coccineum]
MAHKDRSLVLLFMGGGMGAGKSTALKDILKEPFLAGASANAVVMEADARKESDVIYRALSSRGHHDMLQTAELVHQSSTDAASSLLVTALNEGRDVIMDGTLSWVPFVLQTITMARNVHRKRYRMGPGYKRNDDGSDGKKEKTLLVDPDEISSLELVESLNEKADSIYELYNNPNPIYGSGSVWHDIVMSPSRVNIQKDLKHSIQKIESKIKKG